MHSSFLQPRIIDVKEQGPFQAKVTMEPFERGYGHTDGHLGRSHARDYTGSPLQRRVIPPACRGRTTRACCSGLVSEPSAH